MKYIFSVLGSATTHASAASAVKTETRITMENASFHPTAYNINPNGCVYMCVREREREICLPAMPADTHLCRPPLTRVCVCV
jgi:hypothetical protein